MNTQHRPDAGNQTTIRRTACDIGHLPPPVVHADLPRPRRSPTAGAFSC